MAGKQIIASLGLVISGLWQANAQDPRISLKNWQAPPYFQLPAANQEGKTSETGMPAVAMSDARPGSRAAAIITPPLVFVGVVPCRVVDTRWANGPLGGPIMNGGASRTLPIPSGSCGIPAGARAYSFNVTVVPQGALGWLTLWPTGQAQPGVSTLNAWDGQVTANAAVVPAGTGGSVDVFVTNTTHVIVDVNGYYWESPMFAMTQTSITLASWPFFVGTDTAPNGISRFLWEPVRYYPKPSIIALEVVGSLPSGGSATLWLRDASNNTAIPGSFVTITSGGPARVRSGNLADAFPLTSTELVLMLQGGSNNVSLQRAAVVLTQ